MDKYEWIINKLVEWVTKQQHLYEVTSRMGDIFNTASAMAYKSVLEKIEELKGEHASGNA